MEFAAGLQAVYSDAASPTLLAEALRAIERKRASRTHDMVKLARYNVNLICRKRTWLVRLDTHAVFPEGCLGH